MRIAFLYNQKPLSLSGDEVELYAEWDHPDTIAAVREALSENHSVLSLDCHPNRIGEIITRLRDTKPDLCFNMVEGSVAASREAQIPALLDLLSLPYTASDATTLAITHDKARTKEILSYYRIPTARFHVVYSRQESFLPCEALGYPSIVKPLHEGSSRGVFERSVVTNRLELHRQITEVLEGYKQPAIVEEFLTGREFTVGVLGNGEGIDILPIVEIAFDALPASSRRLYSYEAKWLWDTKESPIEVFQCPATLHPDEKKNIEEIVRQTYKVLRCRDWSRIDVRMNQHGVPHIIEVNPLPGILPDPNEHSCLPLAARVAGMSYNELICRVVKEASLRYNLPYDNA